MTWLDIFISIALVYGLVRGFMKGFFMEASLIVALILGIYGASRFSGYLADFLQNSWHWRLPYLSIIAFVILLVAVIMLVRLLGALLTKAVDMLALGFLNKLAGAILGALKWAAIVSVLLFVFKSLRIRSIDQACEASFMCQYVSATFHWYTNLLHNR